MEKTICDQSKEELKKELQELKQEIEKLKRNKESCSETELILKKSEERFRIIFEYAPDGYYLCDLKGNFIDGNIAAEQIVGYKKEELIGTSFLKQGILPARYIPKALKNLSRNLMGRSTGPDEFKLNRKDGTTVWVEVGTYPVTLEGKRVVLGIARDINQRKMAEEALSESEGALRSMFENSPDAVFVADPETGSLVDCNKKAETLTGYSKKEIRTMKAVQLHPEEKVEKTMEDFKKHAKGILQVVESEIKTKDGKRIPVIINSNLIIRKGKRLLQGNFRDITEKKLMEEEMLRNQKLDSLGTLAGGIAHDFNNILMGIAGNIGLARLRVDGESEIYDFLKSAEKAAIRGKDLTQQLLTFASGGAPMKKTVSIGDEIKKAAQFALSGSNVKADFTFNEEEWKADIDTGQFNQALCNIFINAKEEMDQGGPITIGMEKIEIREENNTPFIAGNYIQISIKDQGKGISEDVISKIFDPFFSTKAGNKGMGLSVAYSVVKRHSGYLMVDSTEGKGTVFYVMIPISKGAIHKTKDYTVQIVPKTGKILVMDDEDIIRSVTSNILHELGYAADAAAHGQEAIEKYMQAQKSDNPFDAVIMDLTIPGGMGGEETIKKLLKVDPEAKVVVSSGYSNNPVFANYSKYGFKACMPKPYEIEELKHVLDKILY